jgi:hypothetical protein
MTKTQCPRCARVRNVLKVGDLAWCSACNELFEPKEAEQRLFTRRRFFDMGAGTVGATIAGIVAGLILKPTAQPGLPVAFRLTLSFGKAVPQIIGVPPIPSGQRVGALV